MSLAEDVVAAAVEAKLTIGLAESCTGGMIAAALTAVPGSSAVLAGGVVSYSNAVKMQMLGVQAHTLDAHGAVSEQVAAEMARGACALPGVDIGLSVTGIAGPGGSDHKPEGRVCFGWAGAHGAGAETIEFGALGRANVRAAARDHALNRLVALARASR